MPAYKLRQCYIYIVRKYLYIIIGYVSIYMVRNIYDKIMGNYMTAITACV